jgi:hypothetical protein
MVTSDARLALNEAEVAAKVIDGEAILINLSNGTYYSMDGVGSFVWSLIADHHNLSEVAAMVGRHYDVSEAQARADVKRLAAELLEEKLVIIVEGAEPVAVSMSAPAEKMAYDAPRLHTYRDMGDLLALDPPMPGLTDIPWEGASET